VKKKGVLGKKSVITIFVLIVMAVSVMTLYSYWMNGVSSQYSMAESQSSYGYISPQDVNSAGQTDSTKVQAISAKSAAQAAETAANAAADASRGLSLFFWSGTEQSPADIAAEYADRMVVFTADFNMKVDNIEEKVGELTQICLSYGGFVSTVSTRTDGGAIIMRVPQSYFYNAISDIEAIGDVQSKDVKGEDVTDSYIDLESRLSNIQLQEVRLQEILELATSVEEILDVEAELERIRGEIEQITGQLVYLDSRIELATITVRMNEAIEAKQSLIPNVNWWTPVNHGLNALFVILQGLLSITIVSVPLLVIAVPSYKLYHIVREKYYPITEEQEEG